MSWSVIAEDEVLGEFTPSERTAIAAIQGSADNLPGVLQRVVNAWRGVIRAGGNVMDETTGAIPDQVREDVIAVARWRWLISLPALKSLQTDARKEAYTSAEKRFDLISRGDLRVESGDGSTDSPAAAPRYPGTERTLRYDRESSQDGI